LIKLHHENPDLLSKKILNMPNHYVEMHEECDHDISFQPDYPLLSDQETFNKFSEILQYYSIKAVHFKSGRLTNAIKSQQL